MCPPLKTTGSCHRTRRRTTGTQKHGSLNKDRSDKNQLDLGFIWQVERDLQSWLPKGKSSVFLRRPLVRTKLGPSF